MYEEGIVCSIDEKEVILHTDCECDHGCQSCSSNNKSKKIKVFNTKKLDIKIGDKVEIYLAPSKVIRDSFFVLIFPLILFIGFYIIVDQIFHPEFEIISILFGVLGLVGGFLINILLQKLKKTPELPEIMKIFK